MTIMSCFGNDINAPRCHQSDWRGPRGHHDSRRPRVGPAASGQPASPASCVGHRLMYTARAGPINKQQPRYTIRSTAMSLPSAHIQLLVLLLGVISHGPHPVPRCLRTCSFVPDYIWNRSS